MDRGRVSILVSGRAARLAAAAAVLLPFVAVSTATPASAAGNVTVTLSGGVLRITGTDDADEVTLRRKSGNPGVLEVDVGSNGTPDFEFNRSAFTEIVVRAGGGEDRIEIDDGNGPIGDTESITIDGGSGPDTILAGTGRQLLMGGGGPDTLLGMHGNDRINGGDASDLIAWSNGDGSDVAVGGAGSDRFRATGNDAAETFRVSNNAGHVRFARDPGMVPLDLDGIETLTARTRGGADQVEVGRLGATHLDRLITDFINSGGGDDSATDAVQVPPGVTVSWPGGDGTVAGLGALIRVSNGGHGDLIRVIGAAGPDQVRVLGSNRADDFVMALQSGSEVGLGGDRGRVVILDHVNSTRIDLLGGDDRFLGFGVLDGLTRLRVDGGAGDDRLGGGDGDDTIIGGDGDDQIAGNLGNDVLDGGANRDTFGWHPSHGSDRMNGGSASDDLIVAGSQGDDTFTMSRAMGRVDFHSNVGDATLDLGTVETTDVHAVEGSDRLLVNNVTGTDLVHVRADLSGPSTADDGAADLVRVDGTSGDDTIHVDTVGSSVRTTGAAAAVRIRHANPSDDRLKVRGRAGDDTLSATAFAEARIQVILEP